MFLLTLAAALLPLIFHTLDNVTAMDLSRGNLLIKDCCISSLSC